MRVLAAITVLSFVAASSAAATPFLSATASVNGLVGPCSPIGGTVTSTTGASVSSSVACSGLGAAGSASAVAAIGSLGDEARAQEFGASFVQFSSSSIFSDTVVFSGPGDDPVAVAINLHFGGSLNSTNSAGASAVANATINGSLAGRARVIVNNGVPDCSGTTFSGLTCGLTYNASLQSGLVLVPQDTAISFELDLDTFAGAGGFSTSATALFSNTFSFVTDQPLFQLPSGFTANSPTSFIVNNRFVAPGAPASVPEPSSVLLVVSVLGLVALIRRRA